MVMGLKWANVYQIIDSCNFKPFHCYRQGYMESLDLKDLIYQGYLRVVMSTTTARLFQYKTCHCLPYKVLLYIKPLHIGSEYIVKCSIQVY